MDFQVCQPQEYLVPYHLKALGRWHSSTFLAYLRMPREHLATVSHTLSTLTPPQEQV